MIARLELRVACYLDNDAFIKLVSCNLLDRVIAAIGVNIDEVVILDTFYCKFLTKRKLKTIDLFGADVVEQLSALTSRLGKLNYSPTDAELEINSGEDTYKIDAGEANLFFAASHELNSRVVTADKRCISALSTLPQFRHVAIALQGRVICLEQLLLYVIERDGFECVKVGVSNFITRINSKKTQDDQSLRSIFGMELESRKENVLDGLKSCLRNLQPYDYDVLKLSDENLDVL